MSRLQRVTTLREPPIVGRFYLVPTVEYIWGRRQDAWPVFLPKHEDAEHLNFRYSHYHVDPRFLSAVQRRHVTAWSEEVGEERWRREVEQVAQRSPLSRVEYGASESDPHGPIVWRRRRCSQARIEYHYHDHIDRKLRPAFAGRVCHRSQTGWICPHKRFPLGSIAPVDGVVTCPLHGLRIDAESGRVLGVGECA